MRRTARRDLEPVAETAGAGQRSGHEPAVRKVVAVSVLVAAVAALGGCQDADSETPGSGSSAATDGPVRFEGSERYTQAATIAARPGDRVVFGASLVENTGTGAATFTSAGLTDQAADAGAELRALRVIDLSDGGDMVGAAQWPFEDYAQRSQPLKGFTLRAGGEAELLFIVDVAGAGRTEWKNTELQYNAGGTPFVTSAQFGFHVCAGADC
jgi:hypothetical protein